MYRDLNENELQWIKILLNVNFKDKKILQNQIKDAKVLPLYDYAFISLKFKTDKSVNKYPYRARVPIEMIAYQKETAPIMFLLHVIDGCIDELEIILADLSQMDYKCIELHNVKYNIDKEVLEI